jgi:hypothetical protein
MDEKGGKDVAGSKEWKGKERLGNEKGPDKNDLIVTSGNGFRSG